jgi:hypothetical protein
MRYRSQSEIAQRNPSYDHPIRALGWFTIALGLIAGGLFRSGHTPVVVT